MNLGPVRAFDAGRRQTTVAFIGAARNTVVVSGIKIGYSNRWPSGRCTRPDSDKPQASSPLERISIFATMLSGILIPSFTPRLARIRNQQRGRLRACSRRGRWRYIECAIKHIAIRRKYAAPVVLGGVQRGSRRAQRKGNIGRTVLRQHIQRRRSYRVKPAMNVAPSGAIDSTVDCPVTVRLLRIVPDESRKQTPPSARCC